MVNINFTIKLFYSLALILILCVISNAQDNWLGEYFFGEDGGETAGGSKIYIAHTIKITEKENKLDAHIYSQGFQTSRDIYADVKIADNKIEFYFREKGKDQHTSNYEKGDLLLTLENKTVDGKTKLITNWGKFEPTLDKNAKSGEVYFKKKPTGQKKENLDWIKIETRTREVSFSIPKTFTYFADKSAIKLSKGMLSQQSIELQNLHSITSFENGVSMWMESYEVDNGREAFRYFPQFDSILDGKETEYVIGNYLLKEKKKEIPYYVSHFYFYSARKLYVIGVGARDKSNPNVKKFLRSVKFREKNILVSEQVEEILSLKTQVLEEQKPTPINVSYNYFNPTSEMSINNEFEFIKTSTFRKKTIDKPPIAILNNPKPGYTEAAREFNEAGVIKIRAIFMKNGFIPSATVIKGLKHGLNEKAINAVRRLRFLPPERNGKPYNVSKIVAFNFVIY